MNRASRVKPLQTGERIALGFFKIGCASAIAILFIASGLNPALALVLTVACLVLRF